MSGNSTSQNSAFDPYYTWLGIPPRDQPPNHYRLLGVELYENNRDVIDNAANRQMAHLRMCCGGARAHIAQELLNQVSAARICLLDGQRKSVYDARLRESLESPAVEPTSYGSPQPVTKLTKSFRARTKDPKIELVKIVFGGLVGLLVGYGLLWQFFPERIGRRTMARKKPKPVITSPAPSTPRERPKDKPETSPEPTPTAPAIDVPQSSQPAENSLTPATSSSASPATASTTPESVSRTDQIPASVELPPKNSTTWTTLFPLSGMPENIDLIAAFDPAVAKVSLTLQSRNGATNNWKVQYETAEDATSPQQGSLAELQIESTSGDLQFRWNAENSTAAAALSNSWLRFDLESKTHYLALRQPQSVPALKLSFTEPRYVLPLSIDSPPVTDQLHLEFNSITGIAQGAKFRNDLAQARLDKQIVIEFSEMPGAQIVIKLAKIPQAPLGLIVEPQFKDGPSREFDLTLPQLEKTQRGAAEALQEAKARIPALASALSNAQSTLRSVQNRSVSDRNQARQKVIDTARMEGAVRDANKRLVSMREQEAVAQNRLDNVPRVLAFIQSLEGKQIPFRVVIKGSSAELVLARSE